MDPKVCIERILAAIMDKDWDEAHNALEDLREWADRGGFLPKPTITWKED